MSIKIQKMCKFDLHIQVFYRNINNLKYTQKNYVLTLADHTVISGKVCTCSWMVQWGTVSHASEKQTYDSLPQQKQYIAYCYYC